MGQFDEAQGGKMYLVETVDDAKNLQVNDANHLAYVTQTTLSMDDTAAVIDALREHFPKIHGPKKDDICYATQSRQDAVKSLAKDCDLVLVVGSPNSSNSNRLREVAERVGAKAYLIDNETEINQDWLKQVNQVGITAGASAPEVLVETVVKRLQQWGANTIVDNGEREDVVFPVPKELR